MIQTLKKQVFFVHEQDTKQIDDVDDWMNYNKVPNGGFRWCGGSNRCTDGIVMWSHAIPFGDEVCSNIGILHCSDENNLI